jgi:hypothetical protein
MHRFPGGWSTRPAPRATPGPRPSTGIRAGGAGPYRLDQAAAFEPGRAAGMGRGTHRAIRPRLKRRRPGPVIGLFLFSPERPGREPAFLYYFGDHDPSGVDITRAVEEGIREFAPGADVTLEWIAAAFDLVLVPREPKEGKP